MSINSMTNSAAGRRTDLLPQKLPSNLTEIATAARTAPTPAPGTPVPSIANPANPAPVNTALSSLFGYIPTEVITLYVAVSAALEETDFKKAIFYWFLVATPLVVWAVFASKIKALGKPIPWKLGSLPLWEMFAATIAFTGWATALPNSPFQISQALAGVVILISSFVIGLLAPLFQQSLKP